MPPSSPDVTILNYLDDSERGGGRQLQYPNILKQKNYYIFILFFQNLKKITLYKFQKILWQNFGAPLRVAPGGRCPPPPCPLATPLLAI